MKDHPSWLVSPFRSCMAEGPRWAKAFGAVLAIVGLGLVGCVSTSPRIVVEPLAQDLGQVPQKALEATYTIRNQGGSPLRIDKIETSCACTKAAIDQDTIPPGGSAPLRVTMDPVTDNSYGNLVRLIFIHSNDPTSPQVQVELRMSIQKAEAVEKPTPSPGNGTPSSSASAPPTPTTAPHPTPTAPLDPARYFLPKPVGAMQDRLAPPDVPACPGAKSLEKAIDFTWEKRDASYWREVNSRTSEKYWTYYQCGQSPAATLAFYREWMAAPLYGWEEDDVQEHPEGALLVYNRPWECTMFGHRWVYLWLLPEESNKEVTNLVAAWYDYSPY